MAGKKGRSGRKKKSINAKNAKMTLAETSPHAAAYLKIVAKGELGTFTRIITKKNGDIIEEPDQPIPADPVRVDVCKYVINQDLGMPKQKVEATGKNGTPLVPGVVTFDSATIQGALTALVESGAVKVNPHQ